MNLKKKLKNISIIIVSHTYVTGPSHFLEQFLKEKVRELIFIGHPFFYSRDIKSFFRQYENGKLIRKKYAYPIKFPGVFYYLKDVFYTFYWLIFLPSTDIFIGVDNLNACCGLLLRKLGKTKKVVFYTIDYIPKRFKNKFINRFYHFLDHMAVKYSDSVWNLSSIMVSERELRGVDKKYREKQIVVPIGANAVIKTKDFNKINRFEIVYLGHVTRRQGIQLVISALPEILKKLPKVKFAIIGDGNYIPRLKQLARDLQVFDKIEFTGYIKDHQEIEKRLSLSAIAVAPYVDSEDNFIRYTDPGKVKNYLAAGLPVVITKIPEVAWEIERERCGLAIRCNKRELTVAIIKLLKNEKLLRTYGRNAIQFAQKNTWKRIFTIALEQNLDKT